MTDRLRAKSWDEKCPPPESIFLATHLRDVYSAASFVLDTTAIHQLDAVQLSPAKWLERLRRIVLLAASLHDLGKANDHFQSMICRDRGRRPQGLRHEWVMYWLALRSPWKEWGPKTLGSEVDWKIALWAITGHHPAFRRESPPSKQPPGCGDLDMSVLVTHLDFRSCVDWLQEEFGGGLLPFAVDGNQWKFKIAGLIGNAFQEIKLAIKADRKIWDTLDEEHRRFIAVTKACLLAADVAGSYAGDTANNSSDKRKKNASKVRQLSPESQLATATQLQIIDLVQGLAEKPQPSELEELVRERLAGKDERPFQTEVASSSHRVTFVKAGCGSGKTAAAYLWAARRWPGRRLYFCYPTTGTATEGFKDYLFDLEMQQSKCGARLFHSRADVDADLILNVDHEADENADPAERWLRADSMSAWSTPIVCCTIDRVIGLMQNERKGLMCWPALAQAAFVFDEVHAYDHKLFRLMLRFLRECHGLPALLMTASLPKSRETALMDTLRHIQPNLTDAALMRSIPGPSDLERLKRYHRIHAKSVVDCVREEIDAGGRVLWVCNTVDRVMDAAKSIADLRPLIYHSRFKYRDRVAQHNRVIGAFKPEAPGGVVAICSQVAEVSLDLKKATLLVMDLCPIPAMIQRLGRLNRDAVPPGPEGVAPITRPFCVVEPQKNGQFFPAPYGTDPAEYGDWPTEAREWLNRLGEGHLSQMDLATSWQSDKSEAGVVAGDCCWFDGGPTTTVDSVRNSSPGVTVVMAGDAAVVKCRKRRLAAIGQAQKEIGRNPKRNAKPWQDLLKEFALPMPQPHFGNWECGSPLSGIPQASEYAIEYDGRRGAKWITS